MTALALNAHNARRWLRAREIKTRLPRMGYRLLVITETDTVVIEQHTPRNYLFKPVRNTAPEFGGNACAL